MGVTATGNTGEDPRPDVPIRGPGLAGAIAESLTEGVLAVDRAGLVTYMNPAAEALLGWTEAELRGLSLHDQVHRGGPDGASHPAADCPIGVVARTRQVVHDDADVFMAPDGSLVPIAYTASPIVAEDEVVGAVIAFRDLTAVALAAAARDQALDRLARLQAATAAMAVAPTPDEVVAVAIGHGIESLGAQAGFLMLLDEDGTVEVAAAIGTGADGGDWRPLASDEHAPLALAVSTRAPVWLRSGSGAASSAMPIDEFVELTCALPLVAGDHVLGSLGLGFAAGRLLTHSEQSFLLTLSDQAAQTLERARLFQAERSARERQSFLARASRTLAASLDYEATLSTLAHLLVPEMADSCSVYLLDDNGLRVAEVVHVDQAAEDLMRSIAAEGRGYTEDPSLLSVAETGRVLYTRSLRPEAWEGVATAPAHLDQLRTLDVRSGVCVPLRSQDRILGVLATTLTSSAQRLYADADVDLIQDIADRAAVAIDNANAHRIRTEVARTLQDSLLPPLIPATPGLDVAVRYRSVSEGSEVGGDFFDVFSVGPDLWGVVIGDVSGKGIRAATLTALARHTVRAAGRGGRAPSDVLRALNQAVVEDEADERFCTVCYMLAAPTADGVALTISCGGHPQPLLVEPDGTVTAIGCPGGAIGLFDNPPLGDAEHLLLPGHTVVLFTDGLTEARSPDGVFAEDGLLAVALSEAAGSTVEDMATYVDEAILNFQDGRPRDDMAMILVRAPLR